MGHVSRQVQDSSDFIRDPERYDTAFKIRIQELFDRPLYCSDRVVQVGLDWDELGLIFLFTFTRCIDVVSRLGVRVFMTELGSLDKGESLV